jgi:site-specific recombinase XerD
MPHYITRKDENGQWHLTVQVRVRRSGKLIQSGSKTFLVTADEASKTRSRRAHPKRLDDDVNRLEQDVKGGQYEAAKQAMRAALVEGETFASLCAQFREKLPRAVGPHGKRYTNSVQKQHLRRAQWWEEELGDRPWKSLTPEMVKEAVESRDINESTMNLFVQSFNIIFWVATGKEVPHNLRVKYNPQNDSRKEHLHPVTQLVQFLRACREISNEPAERKGTGKHLLYSAVMVALGTGMRQMEFHELLRRDLDLTKGIEKIVLVGEDEDTEQRTKNGKSRTISLRRSPAALAELRKLAQDKHPMTPLFQGNDGQKLGRGVLRPYLDEASARAGLSKSIGWHVLRHTFATNVSILGANAQILQLLLGHSDLEMMNKYVHLAEEYTTGEVREIVQAVMEQGADAQVDEKIKALVG